MNLTDKVALVTGGAHRVGKYIALALARAGCDIALHYGRSEDQARATAAEIEGLGRRALPLQADLSDPAAIAAIFVTLREQWGRLDLLVNSAASFERGPFDAISLETWDRVMAINLRAPFLCIQAAAPLMRASARPPGESAAIVNIGDMAGAKPWPGFAAHGTSKAALLHLNRAAAIELAPAIRVNALVLGPSIQTAGGVDDDRWRQIVGRLPLQHESEPADAGRAVVFMAQNESMTGATLHLDSGESLGAASH